ncbi:N-acyl homoserine lactonase family protein [Phototrophicus methaneseepsis]|nr:N-acyl homoserine lactonase family protein [Phototrophicus methaneseepsis]
MSEGCYLVQTSAGQNILIDSGSPATHASQSDTSPVRQGKNVVMHLADLGLQPGDIQTVICTHFDIDHVGYHSHFLHADFVVQQEQHVSAFGGYPRYAVSSPYWDLPMIQFHIVDGDVDLLPGFKLLHTPGHAPGHQSILLQLPSTGSVLLTVDAIMMKRLFTPDRIAWPMDDNQDELRASTRKLQTIVDQEGVELVIFGHDGDQWRTLKKAPDFYD